MKIVFNLEINIDICKSFMIDDFILLHIFHYQASLSEHKEEGFLSP